MHDLPGPPRADPRWRCLVRGPPGWHRMSMAAHAAPRRRPQLPRIPWARIARTPARALAGMKRTAVTARSLTLHVGGLGGICTAAYGLDWRAGAAAIGVSLLVLEYLTAPDGGQR